MLDLGKEVADLAQPLSDERLRALKRIIPCATIKAILKKCGSTRACPRLSNWFMVWFTIGLGLFSGDCYRQVFRWLHRFAPKSVPGRSTLCEARHRLGVAPLRYVFGAVVNLLATPTTRGAFYHGKRLMAIDGFITDVPDSDANARVFGYPKSGRGRCAFPQARVVSLCEVGTHVLWKNLIKPVRCSEVPMATYLLRFLAADMLLLWDRGFFSYTHLQRIQERGAELLARVKTGLIFEPIERYPDGSYLAKAYLSAHYRRQDRDGILVRIIDYTFDDPERPGHRERHRLLTTLLDWKAHPAKKLILLYHERWEEELAIDELKTHQRQRPVLRSQTPAGVIQEIYGLLLGHYVVRRLIAEAAEGSDLPPRRFSFTDTLKILRCRLPECPSSERGLRHWYKSLLVEVTECVLPERRDRINPRVIKKKLSKWAKKRPEHRCCPQPRRNIEQAIVLLC
jgi:hypothetical protein